MQTLAYFKAAWYNASHVSKLPTESWSYGVLVRLFFISLLLVAQTVSSTSQKNELSILNDALVKLKAKPIEILLDKTVKLSLLERETLEKGRLFLKPNRLRVELKGEIKTLFVFDGKNFWVQQDKPKDLGGGILVTKIVGTKLKTNSVFKLFLSEQPISSAFNFVKTEKSKEGVTYFLQPTKAEDFPDAVSLKIFVSQKNQTIQQMSYVDELENETTYKFLNQKQLKSIAKAKFTYAPPKGSEVTEL